MTRHDTDNIEPEATWPAGSLRGLDSCSHMPYNQLYINRKELIMAVTSVDLDPALIERARTLTGERSNRAVLDLALRRLIAGKQKSAMIEGIAELTDLPEGLHAPVVEPDTVS